MTQLAIIIHNLLDDPAIWVDSKAGEAISNGYYDIWLDASRYGMGVASYAVEGADRAKLLKAIKIWKQETGWTPPAVLASTRKDHLSNTGHITPDVYIRSAYEKFSSSIRSAVRGFSVHGESAVLTAQIQQAVLDLDTVLRPVEKIEGKTQN